MPHEVIMPALGMAQETGVIVAWLKKPGDAVVRGEPIMEVETDKATVEVEAQASGFLVAVRAAEGATVPVGEVIAVISENRDDAAGAAPAAAPPAAEAAPAPVPVAEAAGKPPAPVAPSGRILASPKARRLAVERGLELALLADAGLAQPFRAADVEGFAAPAAGAAARRLETRVPSAAFDRLLAGLGAETGALATAFAAGALRAARPSGALTIRLESQGRAPRDLGDPDLVGGVAVRAALVLRDLTGTRVTTASGGTGGAPVLTLTRAGGDIVAALEYAPGALDEAGAINLLTGFAERVETPLRHLL